MTLRRAERAISVFFLEICGEARGFGERQRLKDRGAGSRPQKSPEFKGLWATIAAKRQASGRQWRDEDGRSGERGEDRGCPEMAAEGAAGKRRGIDRLGCDVGEYGDA